MAEGGAGACPQVFVVDSQANYICEPSGRNSRWMSVGQKCLLSLTGLTMFGLIVQGCLIYNLYKRTEVTSLNNAHPPRNLSDPDTSSPQDHAAIRQVGDKGKSNDLETNLEPAQERPLAQLIGSETLQGEDNVVQWEEDASDSLIRDMGYSKGRLTIQMKGYYYLYSKLTLNASEECSLIQHKVVRRTKAYGDPIILMRAKSVRCGTQRRQNSKPSEGPVLWNSFLAGIFHLDKGDEIYVTLEDIKKIIPGRADNMIGAFMISS